MDKKLSSGSRAGIRVLDGSRIQRLGLRVGAEGLRVRKGHRTSASGDRRNCVPATWSLVTVSLYLIAVQFRSPNPAMVSFEL